jgi:hypothetical protein
MDSPKYMNKKDFAASIGFTKSMFERRSIQISCILPRGALCLELREFWLEKLHKWEHQQVENVRRASEQGEMKRVEAK